MNAKEAYELAKAQGDISDILAQIKTAAERGKTSLKVPPLNQFQIEKLTALGYSVVSVHESAYVLGNQPPDRHEVSWWNGGQYSTDLDEVLRKLDDLKRK